MSKTVRREFPAMTLAVAALLVFGCLAIPVPAGELATGPLRVHPDNPRYFTDGSGKAIYLTGSHTWASLQDTLPVDGEQTAFDHDAYFDFTKDAKRNDGGTSPFAAGHIVDDLFFFVKPDGEKEIELLID